MIICFQEIILQCLIDISDLQSVVSSNLRTVDV